MFSERRTAFLEALGRRAVAVIHAGSEVTRNSDVHHPFRQTSDLYYLTGFAEPETTLVLRPGDPEAEMVLFVRPRDKERETWDGRRAGVDGAVADYGANKAYPNTALREELPGLLANRQELHYSLGEFTDFDSKIIAMLSGLRRSERRGKQAPTCIVDPRVSLHELRLHKTASELEKLRVAAEITVDAHKAAMAMAAPGVYEYELAARIDYEFKRRGGVGPGYNTIVGAAENATILHYIENTTALRDGDLVLIDAGCERDFYTADVTRTFPANGTFTQPQRVCYELVLKAQQQAIEMTRPGVTIDEIHDHCVQVLSQGMLELGLLTGSLEDCIANESYKAFYMHRTSHWLGMDVHDVGNYTVDGEARPLQPGMVFTIEPGLYIASDADVPEQYRGIGIRIEDDIVVTDDGYENLTQGAPKTIEEIEAACKSS